MSVSRRSFDSCFANNKNRFGIIQKFEEKEEEEDLCYVCCVVCIIENEPAGRL